MRGVGIVLLAAGGSVRMGRPKQLLPFQGTTLLRHAAQLALETGSRPVVVVVGAEAEACEQQIEDLPVAAVRNEHWSRGMGSSLRIGIEMLEKISPETEAVLIMLHDQPRIPVHALSKLVELWQPGGPKIATARYEGELGVPAVFDRTLFAELRALPETEGAKKILQRYAAEIAICEVPEARDDIDCLEDYERLSLGASA